MNILGFINYTHSNRYFATILEIIEKHINEGDKVTAITCNSDLLSCYMNINHEFYRCFHCVIKKNLGLNLLSKQIEELPLINLTDDEKIELRNLKFNFKSTDELRNYKIGNFDIGMGVLSTLITETLELNPDINKYNKLLSRLFYSSYAIYISMFKLLNNNDYQRVYIFNGRFSDSRPVIRICEQLNIEYYTFELGSTITKYALYHNTMPQNMNYMHQKIFELWEQNKDLEYKCNISKKFYEDRSKSIHYNWHSYTSNQISGKLPSNWLNNKTNIVIFTSSEHEFKAISNKWSLPFYKDPIEGIHKINNSMLQYKDKFHIYVRIHPAPVGSNKIEILREDLNLIKSEVLSVIPADSNISTYSLLFNANIIITFGSTIGIEAVYWGKPSILAARSFYRELGGTYNPKDHDELIKLVLSDLKPKDKMPAIMYGYYASTFGNEFEYYKPYDMQNGLFKNNELVPHKLYFRIIRLINLTKLKTIFNIPFILYTHYRIFGISIFRNKNIIKSLLKI